MFAKANDMNKVPKQNLIFVYNAKSGGLNAVLDYVHKMVSPDTYDCNLCKLTYDNFGQIKKWNDFLTSSNISVDYYYKDHLIQIGMDPEMELPAVFFNDKSCILTLLNSSDIPGFNFKYSKYVPNFIL